MHFTRFLKFSNKLFCNKKFDILRIFEDERMRSSRHGLYKLGYACVTMVMTKSSDGKNPEQISKK